MNLFNEIEPSKEVIQHNGRGYKFCVPEVLLRIGIVWDDGRGGEYFTVNVAAQPIETLRDRILNAAEGHIERAAHSNKLTTDRG